MPAEHTYPDRNAPEYDAVKGQLVCPICGKDCGGWCEWSDLKYRDGDD